MNKWYNENDKINIDYNKPIIAFSEDGQDSNTYLLLPQIANVSNYRVIGYNWFNLTIGKYNSCCFYKTVEEALKCYSSYTIKNVKLLWELENEN